MSYSSTVPAAKAGLLALLQERPALDGIVSWGHPGKNIGKRAVFMAAVEFKSESVVAMRPARQQQDESYDIPVWVDVLYEGNDAQAAELAMWTLVAEVEQAVRADKSLNGASGTLWGQVTGKTPDEYISDEGYGVRCKIAVSVRGRS